MTNEDHPTLDMARIAARPLSGPPARQDFLSPQMGETRLPAVVLEGAAPGPTVCVSAGVHGSEYCALETAQRLLRIDPATLRGRLIVLPLVNIAAFTDRATYVNPLDGLNPNRVFPGAADGSHSRQLAHWLTQEVYRHCDCVLDLHSGDVSEYVSPFAIFLRDDPRSQTLARAAGLDFAIGLGAGGMSIDGAASVGVPGVILEAGGVLSRGDDVVDILHGAVLRALASTGLIDAPGGAPGAARVIHTPAATLAPHDGMWYRENEVGAFLEKGAVVGRIRDYFGHERTVIRAPERGFLLYQLVGMPVNEGEVLCWIGEN